MSFAAVTRFAGAVASAGTAVRRCVQGSPVLCMVLTPVISLILLLIAIFNVCLARLVTAPGAALFNVAVLWLVLRLVVRVLVFPGSILLWRRNTEASYRAEMARQFAQHLEHLHGFLAEATGKRQVANANSSGATLEGTLLGFMVVEGLARNFRVQQRDQVKFTKEQATLRGLVQSVEMWLSRAKVMDRRSEIPLNDWLQRQAQNVVKVPLRYAVNSTPLVSEAKAEADGCIERLEQMLSIFYDLQRTPDGICASTRRFLQVPAVGSLNQLRAELLLRYSAQHYWVRTTSGRRLDAVFIAAKGAEGAAGEEESPTYTGSKEDVPLKDLSNDKRGPVVVWCNPNAAYYETMAYESHWLDFYLSQGCSIFVFNYSGFGRSEGHPTPGRLSEDGDAVVDFLRRRGFTEVAVHGRSIGGIAACRIANNNSDIVKVLVADRTFSTLAKAAKYTFGGWAAKGLSLSATWADNVTNYLDARCYKVMLCDPKDSTIPDLAALRTAVAQEVLEKVPAAERFVPEEPRLAAAAEAWGFLETTLAICDADAFDIRQCNCNPRPARSARQPVVGKPASNDSSESLEAGGEEDMRLVAAAVRPKEGKRAVNVQWLQEHMEFVRSTMAPYVDMLRQAMDDLGLRFNASGLPLEEAVGGRSQDEATESLRCFLANLQVWGSLNTRAGGDTFAQGAVDENIETWLAKSPRGASPALAAQLKRTEATLTPERLSDYQRQLARAGVARGRRDFRQNLSGLQRNLDQAVAQTDCPLCGALLGHLAEVEKFMTSLYRFFKSIDLDVQGKRPQPASQDFPPGVPPIPDLLSGSDGATTRLSSSPTAETIASSDSEEGVQRLGPFRPTIDRGLAGYVALLNCGHNGVLSESELQQLALHLRAAKFGKYAAEGP